MPSRAARPAGPRSSPARRRCAPGCPRSGCRAPTVGLRAEDITIAEALKPLGYATGQFGKNHLGDRNEFLPTVHGFDEFFGNLYHLNAEEEPENPDYPKDPAFKARFGPRGVIRSVATDTDDPTVDPRCGKVGRQKIEDTGPLTKKRMETIDDETTNAAIDFIERQAKAKKPFFVWCNSTRMHLYTHVRPSMQGQSGISEYFDGMIEHDGHVGQLLKALDDLGIADDTILVYTTDNGPHMNSWPDGGYTPFRNEKNSNWEGAFRVPAMIRWPGHVQAGTVRNGIVSGLDWFPTLLAAAGDTDVKERLLTGWQTGGRTYKVHLDGFNQLPYLTGQQADSARKDFFYFNDDGQLVGDPLRELEAGVLRAAHRGHAGDLARSVHLPAGAEDVQSAHGPLRAGGHHVEHLQRLGRSVTRSWSCRRRRWWRSSSAPSRSSRPGRRRRASASTRSSTTAAAGRRLGRSSRAG